jgi:hypothetical protein
MTPRLEPTIGRQAGVDMQYRHSSGGEACLLSGHLLPSHESPSLRSSTGRRGYCTRWRYRCSRLGP